MNSNSLLIIIFCTLLHSSSYAKESIVFIYENPTTQLESKLKNELQASATLKDVSSFINNYFQLPKTLSLIFGSNDGPLYDPEKNKIFIPYQFIVEIKNRFNKAKYKETGVSNTQATMDSLMHTIFHEFAHAIIFSHELPVVGKEEDAADGLATVLLIEYFEEGQEIAISAADLFNLESYDKTELEEEDFWSEHSLDIQRYYSTLCHIYGSSPEKYATLFEKEYLSEDRGDICINDYEILSRNWLTLLEPYMKQQ